MTSARRRLIADEIRVDFKVSQRRVSRALGLARSNLRYTPILSDERAALARRIEVLAGLHPRYGYRRIWALLDREGWSVIKKTVRRHWRRLGLKLAKPRANPRPRRPHGQDANACHLRPSLGKDDVWTWDFTFDRTSNGRSLKWLILIDEYTRECLALEARRGMTGRGDPGDSVRGGGQAWRAAPSGPKRQRPGVRGRGGSVVAGGLRLGCVVRGAGEPLAERLCGVVPWQAPGTSSWIARSSRARCRPRPMGLLWKEEYNTERPHSSLGYKTPAAFAATCPRYRPIEETLPDPSDEQPHP